MLDEIEDLEETNYLNSDPEVFSTHSTRHSLSEIETQGNDDFRN